MAKRKPLAVYPRTHGETGDIPQTTEYDYGLSPYTRGNPGFFLFCYQDMGSIPVHTGKPLCCPIAEAIRGVYPRTHGETRRV